MADSEMPLIRRAEAFRTDCNFKIRKKAQVGENSIAKVDSKKKPKLGSMQQQLAWQPIVVQCASDEDDNSKIIKHCLPDCKALALDQG